MADVLVVGDGPGGLSAALFLARAKLEVVVYGQNQSAMHDALLLNYLGIERIDGSDFMAIARRQVVDAGARIEEVEVVQVAASLSGVGLRTSAGANERGKYLVLCEGAKPRLAKSLGLDVARDGVATDRHRRTKEARVYAVGRMVHPMRSQAIISASDGCLAALDILARERGREAFTDWDVKER